AVSVLDNSIFKGTIVSNGAIHFYGGSSLEGRALAVVGAVTLASSVVSAPGNVAPPTNNLVVITLAPADSVDGGTKNYQITWGGTGISPAKTFEYSLDNGKTWILIGMLTTTEFAYNWNVPDTASTESRVRITDDKGLRGVSGMFTIVSSKAPRAMAILTPSLGENVDGGMQNYQITWSGSGIDPVKTFEYSLDNGTTWILIGMETINGFAKGWNVPDTTSQAIVRITDKNGLTATSGIFSIVKSTTPRGILVIRPATNEVIAGGTKNYQIVFAATNSTPQKSLEFSIDGGATWFLIGMLNDNGTTYTWAMVPNVATTQALVRITDANGVTGTSGLFTITMTPGVGSIDALTLVGLDANNTIGNSRTLGIAWEFTPDIGSFIDLEYSLDGMQSWTKFAKVLVSDPPNSSWMTPPAGSYNPVYIRATSELGMTRISAPFRINTVAAVAWGESFEGFALSNYPNPASGQTTFSFTVPVQGNVTLTIVDGRGRALGSVVSRVYDAGSYRIQFNTSQLPPGAYGYVLQSGATRLTRRMSIVR
ncbi:MAG: T9SS type A sorting domain-containing protein, partial [bacterium]|nr:T9SS type A sorting domain-containing protein [Candidatus Kapabacteria bacterium]